MNFDDEFKKDIAYRVAVTFLALALIAVIVGSLSGCGTSTRSTAQTDTVLHETFVVAGTIHVPLSSSEGAHLMELPLSLRIERNSSQISKSDAAKQTKVDAPELGAVLVASLKQAFPALGAVMGSMPPTPSKDWTTEAVTGGGAAALLALKLLSDWKRMKDKDAEIAHHKADAEEGWKLAVPQSPTIPPKA